MRRQRHSTVTGIHEMNLTPLMDLTFLLLITFIITFPLMEQGIPINLPRAEGKSSETAPSLTISINKDGMVYFDTVAVVPEVVAERLANAVAANPEIRLIIRGDTEAAYGKIVEIAAIAKKKGFKTFSLSVSD